jgi:Uma2 family endonuclease
MLARRQDARIDRAEYLRLERAGNQRHELIDGRILAMSGASLRHNRIVTNLTLALGPRLRQRGCDLFASDLRVKIPGSNGYVYPDLVVVCGKPELEDDEHDTLLNPLAIFEVLSPSTERLDRGAKAMAYRTLPSLRHLILIAQDEVAVEIQNRTTDGGWRLDDLRSIEEMLVLPALEISLELKAIYEGEAPILAAAL